MLEKLQCMYIIWALWMDMRKVFVIPANDRLMKELGMSKAHMSRCKKKFTELGLLILVYQGGQKWWERKANEYRINYIISYNISIDEYVKEPVKESQQYVKNVFVSYCWIWRNK